MHLSAKDRLKLLALCRFSSLSVCHVRELLAHAGDLSVSRSILRSVVRTLVSLDLHISAELQLCKRPGDVCAMTPVEHDADARLRERIGHYVDIYTMLCSKLHLFPAGTVLHTLDTEVAGVITQNTQFLFFQMCQSQPHAVFRHFMHCINSGKNRKFYLCYYASLAARARLDAPTTQKILKSYARGIKRMRGTAHALYTQGMLYMLCFLPEHNTKYSKCIDNAELRINSNIAQKYKNMFHAENMKTKHSEDPMLEYFPFDPPTIPAIREIYTEKYRTFEKIN